MEASTGQAEARAAERNKLLEQYESLSVPATRLRDGLVQQLQELISQHSLTLAVPIESRVKTRNSIAEKLERNDMELASLEDLTDLIGLRIIFLFSRDLQTATEAIGEVFKVVSQEDTSARLGDAQFGYHSLHCIVKIPDAWTSLPTFADCQALQAEIQLRTIAQHTWAEASHLLQYKHESSVPFEMRRSINRVAALLETVDLEFERVLSERDSYIAAIPIEPNDTEPLNVDTLKAILDARLPEANRKDNEDYADLERYLKKGGIETAQQLHGLIDDQLAFALEFDEQLAGSTGNAPERREMGGVFSHVSLVILMLALRPSS